jgi:two-component system, OmpR family, phosphate regulon sensor histidine kinase PhoR
MASRSLAISLAVVMITALVVLTVGWVLLTVSGASQADRFPGLFWALLTVGTLFIGVLLVGVILYLILSVKAISLTRQQSNFIDAVTHELKSPIASMKLYLQTLGRRQVSDAQRADFYQFMLEDVERLDHLINQILDAGRLESGRLRSEIESIDMPKLLRQCGRTVCASYRLPLDLIEFDLQPCTVWACPTHLMLVFRNLLDNAVKYAGVAPKVEVTCHEGSHGMIVVRIADNGCGIPPRLRRKVFARFVRMGVELEREKPGAGLGLHIAKTLVQRQRGRIRILGREPLPGTVFEVEIPSGNPPATHQIKPQTQTTKE